MFSKRLSDFACGCGSLLLKVCHRMAECGGTIGRILGQERNHHVQSGAHEHDAARGEGHEFEIYHGDSLTNDWDMLREQNPAKKPRFDARGRQSPVQLQL